jgi:iron complex transport system substrate-binding protein
MLLFVVAFASHAEAATYKDAAGRTVHIEGTPNRIVSMAPSLTEVLYYLGLGDRVVGVTQYSTYPPEAKEKPSIGSYNNINVEKILSLGPDLALGTMDGNMPGVVKLLEQAGIAVYIVNPRKVRDVMKTMETIGKLCGVSENASLLADKLNRRVDHVYEKTRLLKKPLVFLQINVRPVMTVNKYTFHQDVINLAGGKNMAEDEPITYPRISIEEVIKKKPDVIIVSSMERKGVYEAVREGWFQWPSIPAVQTKRVHLIDSDLMDRPSPRIVEGLEEMARLIHPGVDFSP